MCINVVYLKYKAWHCHMAMQEWIAVYLHVISPHFIGLVLHTLCGGVVPQTVSCIGRTTGLFMSSTRTQRMYVYNFHR